MFCIQVEAKQVKLKKKYKIIHNVREVYFLVKRKKIRTLSNTFEADVKNCERR